MKNRIFGKVIAFLMIAALMIPMFPTAVSAADTTATYTPDDSWYNTTDKILYISTPQQLASFMSFGTKHPTYSTEMFDGKTIKLTNDIVWNDGELVDGAFVPSAAQGDKIYVWKGAFGSHGGTHAKSFKGTFDGQGYSISGLYLNASNTAFICGAAYADFENVSFENVCVMGSVSFVGAIVAQANQRCNFDNVSVEINKPGTGGSVVGGFVGFASNNTAALNFTNCAVSGTINGHQKLGGFVGHNRLMPIVMKDCISYATVSGNNYVSGFVGWCSTDATFERCHALGALTAAATANGRGAFAFLWRQQSANNSAMNAIEGSGSISLTDCYFWQGKSAFPLGINHSYSAFNVSVKFGSAEAETYDGTSTTETTQFQRQKAMLALFKNYAIPSATTAAINIEGWQETAKTAVEGANEYKLRFVSSLDLTANGINQADVQNFGYEISLLDDFNAKTGLQTLDCASVYTSITSNYGLKDVTASEFDADYLSTLVVGGIPADGIQNLLVRAYITIAGETQYSGYVLLTYVSGNYAGSVRIGTV